MERIDELIQKIRDFKGKVLDLSSYHIGNDELRVLCDEIKHLTSINTLWLGYNRISDVAPICEVLRCNSSLKTLWLGYNRISDVSSIIKTLSYNSSLERIFLNHNPIRNTNDLKIIDEMLSINRYNTPKRNKTLFEMMLENDILRD